MRTKEELYKEIIDYIKEVQPYEPTVQEVAAHCQVKPNRMWVILNWMEQEHDLVNFVH